jgi:hypothetical protein
MPERKAITNIMLQNGVKLTYQGRHQHVVSEALRSKKLFFVIDALAAGPEPEGVTIEEQTTLIPTGLIMLVSEAIGDFPTDEEMAELAEKAQADALASLTPDLAPPELVVD